MFTLFQTVDGICIYGVAGSKNDSSLLYPLEFE